MDEKVTKALATLKNVLTALDQLHVQGRQNCLIVTAVCNDLEVICNSLSNSTEAESVRA